MQPYSYPTGFQTTALPPKGVRYPKDVEDETQYLLPTDAGENLDGELVAIDRQEATVVFAVETTVADEHELRDTLLLHDQQDVVNSIMRKNNT